MTNRNSILLIFVLFALCSCNAPDKTGFENYVRCIHDSECLSLGVDIQVKDMDIVGDELIVLSTRAPFIYKYDMDSWMMSKSFGTVGRARNEFLSPPGPLNIRNGRLQYYDMLRKALNYVSLETMEIEVYNRMPYTVDFRPTSVLDVDSNLIAGGYFSESRLGYMRDGVISAEIFDYPYPTGDVEGIYRGTVYQSELKAPHTRNGLLVRTLCSDSFELYAIEEDSLVRTYVHQYNYLPKVVNFGGRFGVDFKKSVSGYIRSYVTDERIYLLWSDQVYSDVSANGLYSDIIHVFDWNGQNVENYALPYKIAAFCVSGSSIYAVREYDDGTKVVKMSIER